MCITNVVITELAKFDSYFIEKEKKEENSLLQITEILSCLILAL